MSVVISSILSTLLSVSVLVLATMGITLIFKTSYTTNFAQGSIAVIGGYVAIMLCSKYNISVWAALPLAIIASTVFAGLVDVLLFRRGRNVNALGKQIITMGLVMLITGLIPVIFGLIPYIANMKFFDKVYSFKVADGYVSITANALFCFGLTSAVIALIFILLKYSKWGISVRATASNEYVAQMMGINTKMVTAVTWGIAGGLGALAAVMLLDTSVISPGYMISTQVDAFMAGIMGGMDSFVGPVIGASIIPVVRYLLKATISMWADALLYVIILIVVLIRPTGIAGKKTVTKV